MRRCWLLWIVVFTATVPTSCKRVYFVAGGDCNMNPALAHQWPSPNGKFNAVEQHFDCPGWYALKIEITNPDGTKAALFDDRPAAQTRPPVWPDLKVEWKSDHELWVTYPPRQDTTCTSTAEVTVHCVDGTVLR